MKRWALLIGFVLVASAARADDADTMRKVATDFYAVVLPLRSGIPDAAGRARLRPFVTASLGDLLDQAASAEQTFTTANKNAPPLMEGDIFASLFEGVTRYAVDSCEVVAVNTDARSSTGRCSVTLTYDNGSGKPTHWSDTLLLANTATGWRVDDIAFGGNWDFANRGHLSDTLKQIVTNISQ